MLAVPSAMGAQGSVGSSSKVVKAITSTVERDLLRGEGIALPLTFIVMFFVFGGFVAAGMPIVGAVVSIGGALLSLFGFSHAVELDATVVNIVTLLGLGLSIDYGLLTVSRFREELGHRQHRVPTREEIAHAAERTVATAGRTVLFSGLTVAIALGGLLVFEASIMRAIGVAGVSVVLVAMVVAITLVPALCVVGAKRLSRKAVEQTVRRRPVLQPCRRGAAPPGPRHPRCRGRARDAGPADPVDEAHVVGHRAAPEGRAAAGLLRAARPRLPRALRPRGDRRRRLGRHCRRHRVGPAVPKPPGRRGTRRPARSAPTTSGSTSASPEGRPPTRHRTS